MLKYRTIWDDEVYEDVSDILDLYYAEIDEHYPEWINDNYTPWELYKEMSKNKYAEEDIYEEFMEHFYTHLEYYGIKPFEADDDE